MKLKVVKYIYKDGIYVENTYNGEKDIWAIRNSCCSSCLNKKGKWEYEPMPSSRTDNFLKRCRFTLKEAKKILESLRPTKSIFFNSIQRGYQ